MKTQTVKLTDTVGMLKAGHVYHVSQVSKSRMIAFVDVQSGELCHMYRHEVESARASGRMIDYDDTQSPAMHASVVSSVCHSLPSHYIY